MFQTLLANLVLTPLTRKYKLSHISSPQNSTSVPITSNHDTTLRHNLCQTPNNESCVNLTTITLQSYQNWNTIPRIRPAYVANQPYLLLSLNSVNSTPTDPHSSNSIPNSTIILHSTRVQPILLREQSAW